MTSLRSGSPCIAVAVACLALVGCTDLATQPETGWDAEQVLTKGKPANPTRSSDVPAVFDAFSGAVLTDGGYYEDGVQSVKADIESDGRAWLQTFAGNPKKEAIERRLCVNLTDMIGEPNDANGDWSAFQDAISGHLTADGVCVAATLHTRDHSNGGNKLLDMAIGEEAYSGGKIALTELASSSRNSWEWRLIFDADVEGEGVCITRLPDLEQKRRWALSNGCTAGTRAIDDTMELWRFPLRDDAVPVARFHVPFSLEITQL